MIELARWEIAEVGGQVAREVASSRGVWKERRGLLLRLSDRGGLCGLGEASPLPGHSPDDLAGAASALEEALSGPPIRLDREDPIEAVRRASARIAPDQPAARFALETALLDLAGRRLGSSVCELLAGAPPLDLPQDLELAALIESEADVERSAALGFRTFKVKIGRRDFHYELAALERIRAALPEGAALRLDANRGFPTALAPARLAALAPLSPELVEEPCPDLAALAGAPVPIGADESLVRGAPEVLAETCAAFVLKPALLGGLLRCVELAGLARRRGLQVVVTHLFDGPVALAACAELALFLAPARACGLAAHAGLSAYPPLAVPQISGSHLRPSRLPGLGQGGAWSPGAALAAAGEAR